MNSAFSLAVHILLHRWTALQICIDQQLAGHTSVEKIAQLHQLITNFFIQDGQRVTDHALEESLGWFFTDMFNVALEDGSAGEIARKICGLYIEVCVQGRLDEVERLKTLGYAGLGDSQIQGGMSDDSDDSGSDCGSVYSETQRTEPVIDDDGFQMIQKGHKKH